MFPRRSTVIAVAITGAVAVPLAGGGFAAAATKLDATLSGKKEVPKAANGHGMAHVTLKPSKGRICFRITVKKVGTMMMGHIHKGRSGVAGPVIVPLFTSPTKKPHGCVSAKKSVIRAIRKHPSRYYVNVHTAKFPAGAARGQLH